MNSNTTRRIKEINLLSFREILFNKIITVSDHCLDHLSIGQRKLFKQEDVINTVNRETPRKIFLQANGRYSLYYRKRKYYLKLIIQIEQDKAVIVSFINIPELPR